MSERTASAIANVILTAGAATLCFVVWRDPRLRRVATGALREGARFLPVWIAGELRGAWADSRPDARPG